MNILVVDDEVLIREVIAEYCKNEKYNVFEADNGIDAIELVRNNKVDLVILDIMMPKLDGFSACKEIKKIKNVPIIMLSARGEEFDKLMGFDLGIDDYITKPFSPKELEARVKAVLRRTNNRETVTPAGKVTKNVITTGNIKIDTARRQVFRKNERIRLTGMEFSLLELLVNNSGQAFSRNEILQHVWAYPPDHRIDTRVVDVHISRLRSKLESDPANPELILTARGIGYMFQRIN